MGDEPNAVRQFRKKNARRLEFDTFIWIGIGVLTLYYSDIVNAIRIDSRINGFVIWAFSNK